MLDKKNMLFIYPKLNSFVKRDIEIYEQNFYISSFQFNPKQKWLTPFVFIKQFFFLLLTTWKTDVFLSYFGGYHSFLPAVFSRIWGKKHIIIVGGTDAVSFPSINYGNFNSFLIGTFTRWSYNLANVILPVHKSLEYCDYTYTLSDFPGQGILYHCKSLKTPIIPVNNGYRTNIWPNLSKERIKFSFLTVALTMDYAYYKRKGIDLILEVAKRFPLYQFGIVGVDKQNQFQNLPSNVKIIPPVAFEELKYIYNEYEYYLQLSMCEGLPNALCEAMLSGCVPIGSSAMSIPEIIADTGYILENKSIEEATKLFDEIIHNDWNRRSTLARNRIIQNYPIEKRRKELLSITDQFDVNAL